jgi:hypothetical protein
MIVSAGGSVDNALPWLVFPSLAKIKPSAIFSAAAVANRLDCDMSILLVAN